MSGENSKQNGTPPQSPEWHPVRSPSEAVRLGLLAEGIWFSHYTPVVGAAQIVYMMEGLHGARAVLDWVADPAVTVAALVHPVRKSWCGYMVLRHGDPDPDACLLSKFYLVPSMRGQGAGAASLVHAAEAARSGGARRMWLTVNRHNHAARRAYARMGFVCTGTQVADIGNGYVMDDEVWEMDLSAGDADGSTASIPGKAS